MTPKEEIYRRLRSFFKDLVVYTGYGLLIALVVIWVFSETLWMHVLAVAVLFLLIRRFFQLGF